MTTNPDPRSPSDASRVWASVVALALSLAALVTGLSIIPRDTLEWLAGKSTHLVEIVATDPQSAAAAVLSVFGFVVALVSGGRALLYTSPPVSKAGSSTSSSSRRSGSASIRALAWLALCGVLFLAGCSLLAGCGATPLQVGSMGVTVSLRALRAADDAYAAELDARAGECPRATPDASDEVIAAHNACLEASRDHGFEDVADALDVGIMALGSAIATAADVDAGQALPQVIVDEVRRLLALFDQIEALLVARGIRVPPEVGMVVHALEALIGPAEPVTP